MKYDDLLAKYANVDPNEIPKPEFIDTFIDEMLCVDETPVGERQAFGCGVLLGISTAMSYLINGKDATDLISRMTQFMLTLELIIDKDG